MNIIALINSYILFTFSRNEGYDECLPVLREDERKRPLWTAKYTAEL